MTGRTDAFHPEAIVCCVRCGDPVGCEGDADLVHCNCGTGPFCEECWEGHKCSWKEANP